MSSQLAAGEPAGARLYADYIEKQLAREEERRKSLESRGITVITSSGTLATLLLGLVALSTRSQSTFQLPHDARTPLALALVAFTLAAALAIVTNVPRGSAEADIQGLVQLIKTYWDDPEREALRTVSVNRLNILDSARSVNTEKAWALVGAMAFETVAIAFLAWAMLEIV
jgi:hypothetical protein